MAVLRIAYTRLRAEEKLLAAAASREGIPATMEDVTDGVFGAQLPAERGDVVLARCISPSQNEALAQILERRGVRVVHPPAVLARCGDKLATTLALEEGGIPQPAWRTAFSPEGALAAAEELGYPVVFKPRTGSWGRLLAKVNDREAAEAVVEHKAFLGAAHATFYLQAYVDKGGFDVRAFVIGGAPRCAIRRESSHWITNTARGGRAANFPLDDELKTLLHRVHGAVGGDFLAVDLFFTPTGWLVNEVNDGGEFRNSVDPTGVDIAAEVVRCAWAARPEGI